MAIRWRRIEKYTGLMGVGQLPRGWYLLDSDNDQTYMTVVYDKSMDNWMFVVQNPSTIKNQRSIGRWATHEEAKVFADAWWKKNREAHLLKFK